MASEILRSLSPTLEAMYAEGGRPSIPPEPLLKATIVMALCTVRSERQFCKHMVASAYNLLRIAKLLSLPEPAYAGDLGGVDRPQPPSVARTGGGGQLKPRLGAAESLMPAFSTPC